MKKNTDTTSQIESILLVAEKPITSKEIAMVCGVAVSEIQKDLTALQKKYEKSGLRIIKKGNQYSMVTAPENAETVGKFLKEEIRNELTDAALETLSIVTYKQPITRIEVEEIRGASSDQLLRNLMVRGLVSEIGRKDAPGRPILYGTTMEFLQYFGLENESDIPKFELPAVLSEELLITENVN